MDEKLPARPTDLSPAEISLVNYIRATETALNDFIKKFYEEANSLPDRADAQNVTDQIDRARRTFKDAFDALILAAIMPINR